MHVPKIKVKYLCAPLLAVFLASSIIVALPHKATAQGETYEWFSNSIRANGGRFQSPPVTPVLDSAQTPNTPVNFTFLLGNQEETTSIWTGAQSIQYRQTTCTINFTITLTRVEEHSSGGVIRATGADPAVCDQLMDEYNASFDPVTIQGQPSPLAVAGTIPTPTPQDQVGSADACSENSGELGFLLCPVSNLFIEIATWIDERIMELLYINAARIFNTPDSSQNEQESSEAMYTAWRIMRNIAYVLLLLLGLVMVVSQLLGLELFDVYAIRKMLPRIVIVAITIPLLWPILRLLTIMFNDAGSALMELIISPFDYIGTVKPELHNALAAGTGIVASLLAIITGTVGVGLGLWAIGGGGVLAATILGIVIAVVQALVVLTLRDLLFFALVLVSAPAVALSVFEPFQKGFVLWRRLLTGILLSIPAVAAVLAITKVVAAIAYISHPNLGVIFATLIVIAGYFLFWRVLKSTDKVAGVIDNAAGGVTGWAQKRLADYRNKTMSQRWQTAVATRGESLGKLGRGLGFAKAASFQRKLQAAGEPGGGFFGAKALRVEQDDLMAEAKKKVERGKSVSGDDDTNEEIALAGVGATRQQVVEALVARSARKAEAAARKKSLASHGTEDHWQRYLDFDAVKARRDAEDQVDAAEAAYGGHVGDRDFTVAAAMAAFASNTAWREEDWRSTSQALESARKSLKQLVDGRVVSLVDAASIQTQNKGRADLSGAGFAATMSFINGEKTIDEHLDGVLIGNSPGGIIAGRWEVPRAVVGRMYQRLQEASTRTEGGLDPVTGKPVTQMEAVARELAMVDAILKLADTYGSPQARRFLADGLTDDSHTLTITVPVQVPVMETVTDDTGQTVTRQRTGADGRPEFRTEQRQETRSVLEWRNWFTQNSPEFSQISAGYASAAMGRMFPGGVPPQDITSGPTPVF